MAIATQTEPLQSVEVSLQPQLDEVFEDEKDDGQDSPLSVVEEMYD